MSVLSKDQRSKIMEEAINELDVINLRENGLNDGEILEANQIICYFNYVNRSLNGLGVTTDNDVVGYYANKADDA